MDIIDPTSPKTKKLGSAAVKPIVKVEQIELKKQLESTREWVEFKVYRNDPNDPFKQNSEIAVKHLSKHPPKEILESEDELLLQAVGADLDRSLSVEEIITYPIPHTKISPECIAELERMPSWLRSMMEVRFKIIHEYFKHDTVKFLRNISNRIDSDYRTEYTLYNGPMAGDIPGQIDAIENKVIEKFTEDLSSQLDKKTGGVLNAFKVAGIVAKWKRKNISTLWEPHFVNRAAVKLRRGLSVKPAEADVTYAKEDDIARHVEEPSDSEDEPGNQWKSFVREQEIKRELAAELSDEVKIQKAEERRKTRDLKQKQILIKETLKKEKEENKKNKEKSDIKEKEIKKNRSKSISQKTKIQSKTLFKKKKSRGKLRNKKGKKDDGGRLPGKFDFLHKQREHRKELMGRGHFRRYSRLFFSKCGDPVDPPKRLEHHYRKDEGFHAYVVTLVTSKWFKGFVMFVILVNAAVLAIETADEFEEEYETSEILDEIFLAFYLTEAIVKIYAHPYRYWTSGFNVFDFIILVISVVKAVVDWTNIAQVSVLRVFLIVRALRILRGISLSVQLQVLVTALVETIKTNIFSIVILLVLLVYIAAIVAYYLFGDKERLVDVWGQVPKGMLRMISFVTLDGWFDLMDEFEQAGYQTQGRIFNLICIVLGNFMFSNIFIAIIIMNISEATDIFRERIFKERQEVIRRKKELVFRRQKLDMRQLLARQKRSLTADFFQMAGQFQKLLRHDDLVTMSDICTSPLWMDSCYQSLQRSAHTSNILMNLHRQMADNLLEQYRLGRDSKMEVQTLRRSRYNRYMKLKAKLALIKHEIIQMKGPPESNLRIRYAPAEK